MTIDRQNLGAQQQAAFTAVHRGLGETPAEFTTAGELAALMAALPAGTPVSVAETVRMDPALEPALSTTRNRTAAAATVVTLVDPDDPDDIVEAGGEVRQYGRMVPGVELCAYIVAEGTQVPEQTVAFQPYERAVETLGTGDLDVVLDAEVELLTWMAGTLTHTPPEPGDTWEAETVPQWISDTNLRDQLTVEAERLRQCAARLAALRTRIAAQQAAADDETGE